ncbi:transposase [Geomonas sp. RF6]|uniref:transposase n=1 Tax=Geomonas sp. RF6 TaxID=2897342 RepID=UPI001E41F499|nr:transposase [Geomonas sp. RF6]UFS69296.1 transposase [Geomonas sp. RF6]
MARKARIHYPGAFYHVILRGNCRADIFFAEEDRLRLCLLLQEGIDRFQHTIHAFCLMPNHLHLVMQVGRITLSRIIHNLSFRYTQWVNWRHTRVGHIFQGRYKAILVDADCYLLELVRYVHLNPVRAGIAPSPSEYRWSGHAAYSQEAVIPWLSTDHVLSQFSKDREVATEAYKRFVEAGTSEGRRSDFHGEGNDDRRILAGKEFVRHLPRQAGIGESPKISVGDVISAVCTRLNIEPGVLAQRGKNRVSSRARGMAAWIVQDLPSCTLTELARFTGRDVSTLSAAAQRLETQAKTKADSTVLTEKAEICSQITKCKA